MNHSLIYLRWERKEPFMGGNHLEKNPFRSVSPISYPQLFKVLFDSCSQPYRLSIEIFRLHMDLDKNGVMFLTPLESGLPFPHC